MSNEQICTTKLGENIILYGVPGCGKSYTIKTEYCSNSNYIQRVVFHPDYTYSDFIGQILPVINKSYDGRENISYKFMPGPFTIALKNAVNNMDEMHYLIIEEINRGNAPAIFGEVFQLLDRENGESEYSITNFDIAEEVYGDKSHKIKIPYNLTILATMNTADQNVFTLDTAFKRRWKMRCIENNINGCAHAQNYICKRNVTWAEFANKINDKILDCAEGNISAEDTRFGAYFVKVNELDDASAFAEKVLMYLWNDAFKFDREKVFKTEYKSLEHLIKGFKENAFDVFVEDFNFDNNFVAFAPATISEPIDDDFIWDGDIEETLDNLLNFFKPVFEGTEYSIERNSTFGEKCLNIFKQGLPQRIGHIWPKKHKHVFDFLIARNLVVNLSESINLNAENVLSHNSTYEFKGIEISYLNSILCKVFQKDNDINTVEKYLSTRNEMFVKLYYSLMQKLDNQVENIERYMTKTNDHISIRIPDRVLAEIYIQKSKIRVITKVPNNPLYQIGTKVPDTHGWTLNYTIDFAEESLVDTVAKAIINSHNLD